MEHDNPHESSYETFIEYFDLKNNVSNKDKSALHLAYLIKTMIDKGIRVNFSYHTFVHGEDGDSEETYKENRKGAIHFSAHDVPKGIELDKKEFYYDISQLALVGLKYTNVLGYINKMVSKKYPSDQQTDRSMDSRGKFSQKMSELKHEKFVDGQLVERIYKCITKENFNNFLNIFLTGHLIKEFDRIIAKDKSNTKEEKLEQNNSHSKLKI